MKSFDARAAMSRVVPALKAHFASYTRNDAIYLAVAIFATAPAWIVRHPPLQDLPFHAATLRVIHSYKDTAFGFQETYFINVWRTQYAFYYLVGDVLSYILGVKLATIGLMCLYLGGTPLAVRALLIALGKDERICLFVLPLLVNTMFMLGLLPYVLGIPIMFWALSVAVKDIEEPKTERAVGLAILAVSLFFAHVVHYALFGLGYALLFPWLTPRRWIRAAIPVIPSLLAVFIWTKTSAQGQESAGALGQAFKSAPSFSDSLSRAPQWIEDVFRDSTDEYWFLAFVIAVILTVGLAQGQPPSDKRTEKRSAAALAVIPIVCLILYVSTGESLGDVWLFAQRFPVPGLMALVPLLRMPTGYAGMVATVAIAAVSIGSITNTCRHFIKFETEEVGDLDEAIEHMAPAAHVCALIYDRGSAITNSSPFLHFGSYYQVEKGGVIQFSNAGALYWPVRFKDGHYPPPGKRPRLRWEWMPESVSVRGELYPYYDYVLTRGPGFNPPEGTFHQEWHGDKWAVWKKD